MNLDVLIKYKEKIKSIKALEAFNEDFIMNIALHFFQEDHRIALKDLSFEVNKYVKDNRHYWSM